MGVHNFYSIYVPGAYPDNALDAAAVTAAEDDQEWHYFRMGDEPVPATDPTQAEYSTYETKAIKGVANQKSGIILASSMPVRLKGSKFTTMTSTSLGGVYSATHHDEDSTTSIYSGAKHSHSYGASVGFKLGYDLSVSMGWKTSVAWTPSFSISAGSTTTVKLQKLFDFEFANNQIQLKMPLLDLKTVDGQHKAVARTIHLECSDAMTVSAVTQKEGWKKVLKALEVIGVGVIAVGGTLLLSMQATEAGVDLEGAVKRRKAFDITLATILGVVHVIFLLLGLIHLIAEWIRTKAASAAVPTHIKMKDGEIKLEAGGYVLWIDSKGVLMGSKLTGHGISISNTGIAIQANALVAIKTAKLDTNIPAGVPLIMPELPALEAPPSVIIEEVD